MELLYSVDLSVNHVTIVQGETAYFRLEGGTIQGDPMDNAAISTRLVSDTGAIDSAASTCS